MTVAAVKNIPVLVGHDKAVSVAIERYADIGADFPDFGGHGLGMQGTHVIVDVDAVGFGSDAHDLGAEFLEGQGGDFVARAVGAVHDDTQSAQRHARGKAGFCVDDVTAACVLNLGGTADFVGVRIGPVIVLVQDHGRDFVFLFVRQLESLGVKELDTVVHVGVVRGGDDHAEVGAHAAGQEGYGRRGKRPGHDDLHARGAETGGEGGFEHVARKTGIFANDNLVLAVARAAEGNAGREAEP